MIDKERYLNLLLESKVLKFGEFMTKSGRLSPYFFNMGNIDSGLRLAAAAQVYAELIAEKFPEVTNLYGPAYKGIPLAVATSEKLATILGRDISFTFNRKEAKDHGEGGNLVGRSYSGDEKVVIIEDVITGGTSFRETQPLLAALDIKPIGLVVGVDRQEKGTAQVSAAKEVSEMYGVPFESIVDLDWIVERMYNKEILGKVWIDDAIQSGITKYRAEYGA